MLTYRYANCRSMNLLSRRRSYRISVFRLDSSSRYGEDIKLTPLIPRNSGQFNFAALWQETPLTAVHYTSGETIRYLNEQLLSFRANRTKSEKRDLLKELCLTYFARQHNLIRYEYLFEKSLVEDRLKTWSSARLRREGFALLNLNTIPRGSLFQDKVFRFYKKSGGDSIPVSSSGRNGANLPYHRFGIGDSIRLSSMRENDPLAEEAIDGVVLDRRAKYIDICIPSADAASIDKRLEYRLDHFVNRVSYDRMIQSLQLFLQQYEDGSTPVSRVLRDLLLYSYPNALVVMASKPGGLRLALPDSLIDTRKHELDDPFSNTIVGQNSYMINNHMSDRTSIDRQLTQTPLTQNLPGRVQKQVREEVIMGRRKSESSGRSDTSTSGSKGSQEKRGSVPTVTSSESLDKEYNDLGLFTATHKNSEIESRLAKVGSILSTISATNQRNATMYTKIETKPTGVITVAQALQLAVTQEADLDRLISRPISRNDLSNEIDSADTLMYELNTGVFTSNHRIREMLDMWSGSAGIQPFTKYEIQQALLNTVHLSPLNPSQLLAVSNSLSRPLSLIQGPPGTGKTRTACALLSTVVTLMKNRLQAGGEAAKGIKSLRILACAHSNVATDNLLHGLLALGVKAVRLGRPVNIRTSLWNYTLDALVQQDEQWRDARMRLDDAYVVYNDVMERGVGGEELGAAQRLISTGKERLERVEKKCTSNILLSADVLVSSCIGSGAELINGFIRTEKVRLDTVLIDEAAQCMEPASLPALIHGCERLILVGDQNQLPPVVMSQTAQDKGLGISLFARLVSAGLQPSLLSEQYRMHPAIALFSSKQFYSALVTSKVTATERPLPKGFIWPNLEVPIVFIDVSSNDLNGTFQTLLQTPSTKSGASVPRSGGFEYLSNTSMASYYNNAEAAVVKDVVRGLVEDGNISLSDIGVISPYSAQVRLLIDLFRPLGYTSDLVVDGSDNDIAAEVAIRRDGLVKVNRKGDGSTSDANVDKKRIPGDVVAAVDTSAENVESQSKTSALFFDVDAEELDESLTSTSSISISSTDVTILDTKNNNNSYNNNSKNARTMKDLLEIRSVDGFQGREKDVIIISTVRSNKQNRLGFLSDWRRLNVAVTRAKSGLIVIGDKSTLKQDRNWRAFLSYCEEFNCIISANDDILAPFKK